MTFPVIYDTDDRTVLVVDPPLEEDDTITLPTGTNTALATLDDGQRSVFDTPHSRFSLSPDLTQVVATEQPPDPRAGLKSQITNLAQSAVGVSLADLTAAQRNALTAVMLFELSGVEPDMTVKPLGQWVR